MFEKRLRTWHRRLGIALAPFLLLQTLSGFLFHARLYRDLRSTIEVPLPGRVEARALTDFEVLMATVHFGNGPAGYAYHVTLSVVIGLLIVTGASLWWRRRKRRRI